MSTDARRALQQELDDARDDLLRLAALTAEAVPRATEALLTGDAALAEAVVEGDAEIDRLARAVEERCFHQLARHQPAAQDLRTVIGAMRVAADLARAADLAAHIAATVFRIGGSPGDARVRGLLQRMSDEACRLVGAAIEGFAAGDAAASRHLDAMDDGLDAVHRHYISRVIDACRDGALEIHVAVRLALIGRFYERIGDHAVNVGEHVMFMVTGDRPPVDERGASLPAPV